MELVELIVVREVEGKGKVVISIREE